MPSSRQARIDPHRNLAAIGDEQTRQITSRVPPGLRFSRNARRPSWPSGRHAPRRDRLRRDRPRPARAACPRSRAMSDLGRRHRLGAGGQNLARRRPSTASSRSAAGDDARARARSRARGGREPGAGQEQLARRRPADLREHERRDDRRQNAELHFGEAEDGLLFGDHDVADGRETGAAAERRAVDAADERERAGVSSATNMRASAAASRMFSLVRVVDGLRPSTRCRRRRRTTLPAPASDDDPHGRRCSRTRAAQCVSSAISSSLNALRTSGRLSVRRSTGPSRALVRCWYVIDRSPPATSGRRRSAAAGIGALNAADRPSASAWRVSTGSRIPSSHSRAVE